MIIAVLNSLAMNLNTIACQYEKASFTSLLQYSLVVYAFMIDVTVFGVQFKQQELVGALIVLVFNLYAIINKLTIQTTKWIKLSYSVIFWVAISLITFIIMKNNNNI